MMFLTSDPNVFFADELKILSLAVPRCEISLPNFSGLLLVVVSGIQVSNCMQSNYRGRGSGKVDT